MEEGGEQHQKENNTNRGPRRILQAIAPIIETSLLVLICQAIVLAPGRHRPFSERQRGPRHRPFRLLSRSFFLVLSALDDRTAKEVFSFELAVREDGDNITAKKNRLITEWDPQPARHVAYPIIPIGWPTCCG